MSNLGKVIRTFGPKPLRAAVVDWAISTAALWLVGTVACVIVSVSQGALWSPSWWIAMALVGWSALTFLLKLAALPQRSVDLCEHGVRFRFRGIRSKELAWGDLRVTTVRKQVVKQPAGRYIRDLDKEAIVLSETRSFVVGPLGGRYQVEIDSGIQGYLELGEAIVRKVEEIVRAAEARLLDDLIAAAESGPPFDCGGGLRITRDGLMRGNELRRWAEIKQARQVGDEIVIVPAFVAPERPVMNAHVVAKAVQILAERHRPGPQTPFR